jgi:polysaccharide biosynthesis/export protein
MRVTRSLLILLAVSIAAAGCAMQPEMQTPVAAAPAAIGAPLRHAAATLDVPTPAASSIDATVYGSDRAPAAVVAAAPTPEPASEYGLMMTHPLEARSAFPIGALPANASAYAAPLREKAYTLDSGDRLRIVVFGQDGLSNSYLVDASGYIAMPLIGSVLARGETTDQFSSRIAGKLRQGYIRDPHVAVEVEAYRPFFILGEVAQPGQYPYVADMTAETAVAIAGGFGPRAYRRSVNITRIVNGQELHLKVPPSYPLRPGDTVNVQERWF